MKKGFTLVELSIVLVIVGILIGGILVGQTLIDSSKITAQVAQFQQFDAAVNAFRSKYKYLPGDAPAFGGDGTGAIMSSPGNDGASYVEGRYFAYEICKFWTSLDASQFPGSAGCVLKIASTSGSTKNVPLAKLGKNGSFIIAQSLTINGYHVPMKTVKNYYAIIDGSQAKTSPGTNFFSTTTSTNSAVRPIDLLALDQKMDDGVANAGDVASGAMGDFGGGKGGIVPTPLTSCSTGATYTTVDTYECTPLVRLGSTGGTKL